MNYEYIVPESIFSKRVQEHRRRSFKVHPVFAEIGLSPFIFREFFPPYRVIGVFSRRTPFPCAMTSTSVISPMMVRSIF